MIISNTSNGNLRMSIQSIWDGIYAGCQSVLNCCLPDSYEKGVKIGPGNSNWKWPGLNKYDLERFTSFVSKKFGTLQAVDPTGLCVFMTTLPPNRSAV